MNWLDDHADALLFLLCAAALGILVFELWGRP